MARAFVIGNGLSLVDTPMARLSNELTIACNRFDLAQEKLGIDWDPTYWVLADLHPNSPWWDWEDLSKRRSQFILKVKNGEDIGEYFPDAPLMPRCGHIGGDYVPTQYCEYCEYGGSIGFAISTAVDAGASVIYLVGCDLYVDRSELDYDPNHFDPEYCPVKIRKRTGERIYEDFDRLNGRLVLYHELVARDLEIPVFNATVGGKLEVYPRVDIFSLLDN